MDKKEYFNIRFKRDFLQYSLLQEDSLPAIGIAGKLYETINLNRLAQKAKLQIEKLLETHLSFDKIKVDGKLTNDLPKELEFGIQNQIADEFRQFIEVHYSTEISVRLRKALLHNIEKSIWDNGITEMDAAIGLLIERINNAARNYNCVQGADADESELAAKYNEAKENTLLERIQGSNVDDIIEYRNALREYVRLKCENILYATIKNLFSTLAADEAFKQLQQHIQSLQQYAQELKVSLPELLPNAEWDAAYNHLVPTDFYFRNVEGITAEYAFHMVLFQFFAKREDWMEEQGMLVDGELCVYTGQNPDAIHILLQELEF